MTRCSFVTTLSTNTPASSSGKAPGWLAPCGTASIKRLTSAVMDCAMSVKRTYVVLSAWAARSNTQRTARSNR